MTKERRSVVENLTGRGRIIKDDNEIGEVEYQIKIIQKYSLVSSVAGEEEIEGKREIKGRVAVIEGERNLSHGEILTLVLEDGRRWDFFARGGDPISGYIAINASGKGLVKPD
jgi:hypothetical protein